ncbi:replication initiation protein [Corynebacterium sp. P5848]|uniref:replication initiation protein n=1 Tax=Corynebacterium marambiense TaxID=2765364 RepID=UPI002260F932|nr:replication initiation protein [Corynebacterium marambiense]MCX7543738.1 replication initiation protein [Corynebacterium marambiense]
MGVNPLSEKCQLIWYIEKVYTSKNRTSPNSRLLTVPHTELTQYLGADRHVSHGISRWPFYAGDDMTAYRGHNQHHTVVTMGSMVRKVRTIIGKPATAPTENVGEKQYSSGWERIEAGRASAAQGRMLADLDRELLSADDAASDLIDGARVRWIAPGRAARDETAFRHALAEGHRLHGAGSPMKDNLLIDAYERAYMVAQTVGADGREPEIPPMSDRLTMARRVRGYVVNGRPSRPQRTIERQTSAGRKGLLQVEVTILCSLEGCIYC